VSGKETDDLWRWWEQEATRRRSLDKGAALFFRGDAVDSMFRVESGQVRLERRTIDGKLLVLSVSGPGDLVAEGSLFASHYHCDASAIGEASVSLCAKPALLAAMAQAPAVGLDFGRLVARQLQAVRLQLELRNVRSAEERILLYLEMHADPASRRLALAGPLQDIAAEIGLTREALYRALARLERDGAIRRETEAIALLRGL
jgi:CRP/FNR family transcriptional regulator, dissimilatory nitrate respiration regulator